MIPKDLHCCGTCIHGTEQMTSIGKFVFCDYHTLTAVFDDCCDNYDPKDDLHADVIQTYRDMIEAYICVRTHNNNIPDETLDYMKDTVIFDIRRKLVEKR